MTRNEWIDKWALLEGKTIRNVNNCCIGSSVEFYFTDDTRLVLEIGDIEDGPENVILPATISEIS